MKKIKDRIQFTSLNGFKDIDFESEIKKAVPEVVSFELVSETNFAKIFKLKKDEKSYANS